MLISLVDRFGDTIMSGADGEHLRPELLQALRRGETVTFDFAGVAVILSAFLNPAVGGLYAELPPEVVDSHVSAVNASELQQSSFEAVKERARVYHTDRGVQQRRDAAITDLLAG